MFSNLIKTFTILLSVYVYWFPFLETYLLICPFLRCQRLITYFIEDSAFAQRGDVLLHLTIFGLTFIGIGIRRIPYLLRFHALQALMLSMVISLVDTAAYLFTVALTAEDSIGYPIFNMFCFIIIALIVYCAIFALVGKITRIPLLTMAVQINLHDDEGNEDHRIKPYDDES
jgi:uncharacterized membrane protein|mmetsp:Transcript_26064/g.66198  ORF Transcript_26064/g.66198 Transcript_26064/m.66198 type:complete len:172 (-) Transcript_26064:100-615(-)